MTKETFYFSHDYNSRTDDKIKKLIRKHGIEGYGVYWCIVEDLYNNANAMQMDSEGIAFDLRVDESMVKSILNDFELFTIKGDVFYSESINKRLDARSERSSQARAAANKRWAKQKAIDANALQTHSDSNAIKDSIVKDIKEYKSKEDNNKPLAFSFLNSLLSLNVNEQIVKDYLKVRKTKKAANTLTAFKGVKSKIEKSKFTAEEYLTIAAERSWIQFDDDWVKSEPKKKSFLEENNIAF